MAGACWLKLAAKANNNTKIKKLVLECCGQNAPRALSISGMAMAKRMRMCQYQALIWPLGAAHQISTSSAHSALAQLTMRCVDSDLLPNGALISLRGDQKHCPDSS
jgi:hypothetical protein